MLRIGSLTATIAIVVCTLLTPGMRAGNGDNDRQAVEGVVRAFEQAVQEFDFAKADSLTTPDVHWIEDSYPIPLEPWPSFFFKAKDARLRIDYRPRDFVVHVKGDVAWVTATLDSIFTADTEAGKTLLGGKGEWRPIFVESEILVRTPNGWKITLGHTTRLPENNPK
jgi:ketosteroid isomerase-like protein